MSTAVLVALIGAVPALATAVVSIILNNRVLSVKMANLQDQFDRVEKKVDKHNNFMERIAVLERDDKTAFNEINEVKSDVSKIQDKLMA